MAEPQFLMHIVVCISPAPAQVQEYALCMPAGSTLGEALQVCGQPVSEDAICGVWGASQPRSHVLADGDRVEVYRPLVVDPKVARRERFARQGARRAGLFSKQRVGGKAGY
jgi:putative ubiquitin-RnfH superfamily antitoxin RatB of RatAB toxin-antitoxin module